MLRSPCALAWSGFALIAAAGAGCGRIGYDPLSDAPHHQDAAGGAPDAQGDGGLDASAESGDATDAPATPDTGADSSCSMTSAVVDYCTELPPLPAAPVIDGVLDCGPALVSFTAVGWRGAVPLFPAGNSASVAAAWRPDGIYVFMAVTTPAAFPADPTSQVYYGAGVEVFVDDDGAYANPPAYDNPGTMQVIATAPAPPDAGAYATPDASADAAVDALTDGPVDAPADAPAAVPNDGHRGVHYRNEVLLGPWSPSEFGTFPTPGGFVFEGFITAADLGLSSWTLAAGQSVGFDVAVDVSFTTFGMVGFEGHRAGQYFFHVGSSAQDAAAEASPGPTPDASLDGAADGGDASTGPPPVGPPYMDTRSFCNPTLTSM
jgi:hypothetical protein